MFSKFCSIVLFLNSLSSHAELLTYKKQSNIIVQAEYIAGASNSPVIILLPPFLQGKNFYTTRRLGESLASAGLNVLLPTVSYDISLRKEALDCDAIHSHSMQSDTKEIDYWVNLMAKRSGKKVIILGHSFGANHVLHLVAQNPRNISKVILLSIGYFGAETPLTEETQHMIKDVKNRLKNQNNELDTFSLSFCKNYITTPKKYMSYAQYDKKLTLITLQNVKPELLVIVGERDKRIGEQWIKSLKNANINVIILANTAHFFDGEIEFSLLDAIESYLEL